MNDFMKQSDDAMLSSEGERRRRDILRMARGAARSRKRRRLMARGATGGVLALLVALGWWERGRVTPLVVVRRPMPEEVKVLPRVESTLKSREIVIERVETDRTLSTKWALGPQEKTWQVLTDEDLLRRLAEAGKPAGLAYVDGRARLLFREVGTH